MWRGTCWLRLTGTRARAPRRAAAAAARAQPVHARRVAFTKDELDAAIRKLGPDRYEVQRELLPRAVARAGSIMHSTRFIYVRHYAHVVGMRLVAFPQDGLLARLGLERGDLVKTLNGLPLSTLDGALEAQQLLASTQRISLLVQRAGRTITLDYQIPR